MGLYHPQAIKGDELKACIGKPEMVCAFDGNTHATGAGMNDHYKLFQAAAAPAAPASNGPSDPTPT